MFSCKVEVFSKQLISEIKGAVVMAKTVVKVKFLSTTRYLVGVDEVLLEFNSNPNFSEVLEALYREIPRLREVEEELKRRGINIVYVVNGRTPRKDELISGEVTLYVLPPASGG